MAMTDPKGPEWLCSECGDWVSTKHSAHIHLLPEDRITRRVRRESDPMRDISPTRAKPGEHRWFVVYSCLPTGRLISSVIPSDDDVFPWPHGWPAPVVKVLLSPEQWDLPWPELAALYAKDIKL